MSGGTSGLVLATYRDRDLPGFRIPARLEPPNCSRQSWSGDIRYRL